MIKVSVNIVTKDRAWLLSQALDSVLSQTFDNYEVVVIDDGSTDNTSDVIKAYSKKFKEFRFKTNTNNLGVKMARQQALEMSMGNYVAILDDDDLWIKNKKMQLQSEFLDTHQQVGLVGTFALMLDTSNSVYSEWEPPIDDKSIRDEMLIRSCFMNPTVMFRRELALRVGGYTQGTNYCEDYSMWIRMALESEVANIPDLTTQFRIHNNGLTERNNLKQISQAMKLCFQYRKYYPHFVRSILKWLIQYAITMIFGVRGWAKVKSYVA